MSTNDERNPMNTGTGAGSNYGTSNTGTGLGNSGNLSTDRTTYGAGTDYNATQSGAAAAADDVNTTPTDSQPGDDYSATAKGAAVAGSAGAAVGRGIDAVQNTTDRAAHAVKDAFTGDNDSYNNDYREGSTTSGIFRDRSSAERAYQSLHERGYHKDDVHLMMSDETRDTHFAHNHEHTELGDKAMEGAGVGSAIGGTAGAIIGAIAAIGTSVALPGLGLIIAGPLAAALAGAGAGGLTGGLVGALVGSGIPEEHAAEYEEGIKNGGIVMGVKPRNAEDAKYFEEQFRSNDADKVYRY
ncbi:MAG TPA: hypothetical protein VFO93_02295 [Hymenobacter sp.]|uniref:hypothetical protein n=1 Tax=Hymenobacter sp. TaxID=1898978 RepID=UPI002D801F77|nr:hypothetical protein [Hymenobacter sp.]HET9502343.1 hypothetical protein [Hymenobacter sp.]